MLVLSKGYVKVSSHHDLDAIERNAAQCECEVESGTQEDLLVDNLNPDFLMAMVDGGFITMDEMQKAVQLDQMYFHT
jgi:hypothetical protein